MVVLSNKNILLILLPLTLYLLQSNAKQEHDDMGCSVQDVLCVKDVLTKIAETARSIEKTINETQANIATRIESIDTVNRYVKFQVVEIDPQLPTPKYHTNFGRLNNINKVVFFTYLIHLLLEAHDAMSFYYNTIGDILHVSNTSSTDDSLKIIQNDLRRGIICEYRNVLSVYCHRWTTIDRIKLVEFSKINFHMAQTFLNDAHSMIVIDILRIWMDKIHRVIDNLEKKYV
ncbi:unnamed protein product [Rotaria magnacalcarata]|uniref:Uncharacterized protein n=1 Tax=Rotaria magnacalcarata TaxID=392030 RepID=A0A8S2LZ58_9BILA|nr:unnamed protein product [Rotaria magnacalcarata]CAF3837780.1 unnamed protein product [Rotaria magnacalcarata]CAF3925294.1 unnamed protein product [Rotaria magnacalcarata]